MPPDDLPIDQPADDSTKSPRTKPLIRGDAPSGIRPDAEVRGGSAQRDELPIEQQKRQDEAKP